MYSTQPRIAIIGGGPAGLTTGLLLHNHSIPFTIFELRQKPTEDELARPSGMLDLHEESGIAAIKECGLFERFAKLTGECTEADKVSDKDGNILYSDEGGLSDRPEISRHALSKLLMSHVPTSQIKWGYKLFSASRTTTTGQTEIELDFGPQGKQSFDLVIGADGAWSKVRNLLTDVKPQYARRQVVTLTIANITKKYPHLAELIGLGSFSALGNHHGVMSQRGPQDSARIYLFLTIDDEYFASTTGLADQTAADAKERLLSDTALLGPFGSTLKELVSVACDEEASDNSGAAVDIRPLYVLPAGNTWQHKAGATLIGDASHLMSPFAGEGVNLAMWDSLSLAHTIIKASETADRASFQTTLDPLMRDFEIEMAARAKEKAEESFSNGEMMFGDDAANAFTQFFLSAGQPPE